MKKLILSYIVILFVFFVCLCDPPVNPDDFPTEVRDSWETVNQLHEYDHNQPIIDLLGLEFNLQVP